MNAASAKTRLAGLAAIRLPHEVARLLPPISAGPRKKPPGGEPPESRQAFGPRACREQMQSPNKAAISDTEI